MKIIISPAKQMKVQNDFLGAAQMPGLLAETEKILAVMKQFSQPELKNLFRANDKITEENYNRYQTMNLTKGLTPAILAYRGLAYTNMAPQVFSNAAWEYVKKNLKILSGFYGILNAMDGVVPYRLEMQTKVGIEGSKDLYAFWGELIYRVLEEEIRAEHGDGANVILNLASKEYSQVIEPFVAPDIRFVTCIFGEEEDGKIKTKGTLAKMARGQMCAWLAENQVEALEQVKDFTGLDFQFCEEFSTENELVFLKK